MSEEKKLEQELVEEKELDLEDLEQINGGSLRDVYITPTVPIDESHKLRI